MKSNKQMLKEAALGLTKSFLVIIAIVLFKMPFVAVAIMILILTGVTSVIQASRAGFPSRWFLAAVRSMATTLLVLFIIAGVYKWLAGYTILALLVVVLFIAGLILWSKRAEYMTVIRHIETQIWGATAEERRDKKKARKPYE